MWKIGPCAHCHQTFFVSRLNIQQRIDCDNCGHPISLPPNVSIGYTLRRAVRHAIQEGIIPVVLTGRFLRNMTNNGFLWLPGIKYHTESESGDIDLLACCDGMLVFCECKSLSETPIDAKLWDKVVDQFLKAANLAKRCHASLVVLAAQVPEFPNRVHERLAAELSNSIQHLLLDRTDLDNGYRKTGADGGISMLGFSDLVANPFPELPRRWPGKPRTIETRWGKYERQG